MTQHDRSRIDEAPAPEKALAGAVCALPAPELEPPVACPNCRRLDTLILAGDVHFCAACGYASDGARGCT